MTKMIGRISVLLALASTAACSAAPDDGSLEGEVAEETGVVSEELAKNALTFAEQRTVLKLVDDICGDTWCEGDHNFRFERIVCEQPCRGKPAECRLKLRMFEHGADPDVDPSVTHVCKTGGFTGFASLVETSTGGFQSLQPAYYDALSACINALEGN